MLELNEIKIKHSERLKCNLSELEKFLYPQGEKKEIYFDNAASTRLSDKVLAAMWPYFQECFANASAVGPNAARAMQAVQNARRLVANLINAQPAEIYFTSGGTESDNWAIKGAALARAHRGRHIITSAIEHPAVLKTCAFLQKQGFEITKIRPNNLGLIEPKAVQEAIRPDTILISLMAANNEFGTIQALKEVGAIAKAHGIWFHTDAVQACGHIPLDVEALNIDFLSASGHKFNGPKGIGFLYKRKQVNLESFMHGGGQEWGLRAGTLNTPAIVGLGVAAQEAQEALDIRGTKTRQLRDRLIHGILETIPKVVLTGHPSQRLDGNASFLFTGLDGHSLALLLAQAGITAAAGSACATNETKPSSALMALGYDEAEARGALRFSLDHENTISEVDEVIGVVGALVKKLRQA